MNTLNTKIINETSSNSDYLWNILVSESKNAYNDSFPLIKKSIQKCRDKEWITPCLKKSCRMKEKLYKKWLNNKTAYNESVYKKYKNTLKKLNDNAKEKYYMNIFELDKTNTLVWEKVNKIRKQNNNETIKKVTVNGTCYNDTETIADRLNNHFATIGEKMSSNIIENNTENFQTYMPTPLNQSILLTKTNEKEILDIMNKLHDKNSSGDDLISQKLLKHVKNIIAPLLSKLINASINDEKYPHCLKVSKIVPIFKSGNKEECTNYRPITLLSSFNKIFEKKYKVI